MLKIVLDVETKPTRNVPSGIPFLLELERVGAAIKSGEVNGEILSNIYCFTPNGGFSGYVIKKITTITVPDGEVEENDD